MSDTNPGSPNRSASTVPLVPPSSSEVVIRTMASDFVAMGQSGGLPTAGPMAMRVPVSMPAPSPRGSNRALRALILTLMILIGALILFGLGFYVLPKFIGS